MLPEHEILVTWLAGIGEINPHVRYEEIESTIRRKASASVRAVRHSFARSLRDVSDEDLSIGGIFIVARKQR